MFNFLFNKFTTSKKKDNIFTEIEIQQNICSNECDTSSCIFYNMNKKICKRDYMDDFINYDLCNDISSSLSIIINDDLSNIIKLNTKTYYNNVLDHYYYEYDDKFHFNTMEGCIELIVKKNNFTIATIKFNYKLNKPMFNSDIIKIEFKKNIVYLFVKRHNLEEKFYIYKIIYTNVL